MLVIELCLAESILNPLKLYFYWTKQTNGVGDLSDSVIHIALILLWLLSPHLCDDVTFSLCLISLCDVVAENI